MSRADPYDNSSYNKTDYELGYEDGQHNRSKDYRYNNSEDYDLGYTDGQGDVVFENLAASYRPVDNEYALLGDPPLGFDWAGEKRTPEPGDFYLTKAGGAKLTTQVRRNSQQRHILTPLEKCNNCVVGNSHSWGRKADCPLHSKASL